SGQKGHRGGMGQLMAMGGLFLDEACLRPFKEKVDTLAKVAGVPEGTELKWSPPGDNWIRNNLKGAARTALYCEAIRVAREYEGRVVVVVWDTGRTTLKGPDALRRVIDYLFERVTMHLEEREQRGLIVADRPGGGKKDEDALLEDVVGTMDQGTQYVKSTKVALNLLTTPSHVCRHLQVADLIVGCTTSMVAGENEFAPPLFDEVKPLFIKNYHGYAGGTGLKLFPDDLTNLYHYVLGEKTFARVAANAGVTLPWRTFPYYYDGGDPSPRTDARGDRA